MLNNHSYGWKAMSRIFMLVAIIFLCSSSAVVAQAPLINLPYGKIKAGDLIDSLKNRNSIISWPVNTIDRSKYINTHGPAPADSAESLLAATFHLTYTRKNSWTSIQYPTSRERPVTSQTPYATHCLITIIDENQQRLPSTTLQEIGTSHGYITKEDGTVNIQSAKKLLTLIVSHVGMVSDTITLSGWGMLTVRLKRSDKFLDQDIVIGYDRGIRRFLTGDHSTIVREKVDHFVSSTIPDGLEGLIPGLLITRTSGIPGASSYIALRGQSSIYNNCAPLFVVDEVVFAAHNESMLNLIVPNAAGSLDPLSLFSPADIENIEVLRDADATAIYGSRGANGVILLTTRKGNASKPQFHLRFSSGIGEDAQHLPLMNTHQYLNMRREAFGNDQPAIPMTPANAADLTLWDTTRYTNWSHWLVGSPSHLDDLQLSFDGSNNHNSFFLGLSGLRETSVFPGHPVHQQENFCLDVNHQSANGKWTAGLSVLLGLDQNNQFLFIDPTSYTLLAPDAPPVKNTDGSLYFTPVADSIPYSNPLSFLEQPYQAHSLNNLISYTIRYTIRPWLIFKTDLGYSLVTNHESGQTPIRSQNPVNLPTGTAYFAQTSYEAQNIEPQVEVNKRLGKLLINNLTGYSWQKELAHSHTVMDVGYTNDAGLNRQSNGTPAIDTSLNPTNYDYRAWFSRATLNYNNTYILNLSGRLDGSNRFGDGIHYAPFYAIGAAFVFSQLNYVQRALSFLSLGKLRANMGITGNDQIGDHRASGYAPTNAPTFNNIPGYFSSNQVATGASWETIRKKEIALDLGFVQDRYLLTFTWYQHQSKDQLLPMSYPTAGSLDVFQNWPAVLRNSGLELHLSAQLIDKPTLSWTIDLNWSLPTNRLVSFPDLAKTPFAKTFVVGRSIDVVQGWQYTGVNPQSGLFTFRDLNRDGKIDDSDKTVIGRLDPRAFGGLGTTFRYKNLQLECLFDARLITGTNYITAFYANNPPGTLQGGLYSNAPAEITARWQKPNDHATYQQVATDTAGSLGQAITHFIGSDARLANASFFRLKRLMLSFSPHPSTKAKLHLPGITIFVAGEDLIIFSPYKHVNPEIQSAVTLPPLRIIKIGLQLAL